MTLFSAAKGFVDEIFFHLLYDFYTYLIIPNVENNKEVQKKLYQLEKKEESKNPEQDVDFYAHEYIEKLQMKEDEIFAIK